MNNMIKQAKEYDIAILERILCDTLLKSLHGSYNVIVDNYNRNFNNVTVKDILNDIVNVYSEQQYT